MNKEEDMPYQVLIADDEQIIREGLSFLIDWDMLDCAIAYRAKDGEETIDYLKSHPGMIDIVVTDIKMPTIDGLGVAQYVNEHCPFTQTIILTAYTDFSLAQRAIRHNVCAFVVKNDIAETLPPALRKAQATIQEKRQETIKLKTADNLIRKTRESLFETTMRNAVNGLYEPALDEDGQRYVVIAYEIHEPMYRSSSVLDDEARSLISLAFLPLRTITAKISRRVFCTMITGTFSSETITELLEKFQKNLLEHSLALFAGVSDQRTRTQDLYPATKEAVERLHDIHDGHDWLVIAQRTFPSSERTDIRELIRPKDYQSFSTSLRTYCDTDIPFETLRLDMIKVLTALSAFHTPFSDSAKDNEYVQELQKAQSRLRLIQVLEAYAMLCLTTSDAFQEVTNPLIREVITFIRKNYSKPINLQTVARTFQVSDSYLSRLYRKETGQSLVRSLNERRIQAAKILLEDPTMRIFEISSAVGISDSTYFAHLFLKYTKMTPTEYRQRLGESLDSNNSQEK